MSLFAPTNIIPSSLSGVGEGTVDASEPLNVSWQINGTSPMTAYQITIYQNDAQSTPVYSTGRVTLDTPVYGTDAGGNAVPFIAPAIQSDSITNGNEYKLVITQWWSDTDSVAQPSASPFITRKTPTCTITGVPSVLSVRDYTFTGAYLQEQNDSLSRVRWVLSDGQDNILSDTGWVSTEQLIFFYDGFFTGSSYSLSLNVETQNGQTASDGIDFSVSYPSGTANGSLTVCSDREESAINVSWEGQVTMNGTPSGNVTARNGKAVIGDDASLVWDNVNNLPMRFDPPFTTLYLGTVYKSTHPVIEIKSGNSMVSVFSFGDGVATLTQNGAEIARLDDIPLSVSRFGLAVTPEMLYVFAYTYPDALHPSDSLTPQETLYPHEGERAVTVYQTPLNRIALQTPATRLTLHGAQACEWFSLQQGVMPYEDMLSLFEGERQPTWGADTYFLALFEDGSYNGGNRSTLGYAIYRRSAGQSVLRHIADLPLSATNFKDYGAKSQQVYTYYQFNIGENTYTTAPLISVPVAFPMPRWALLECRMDENGVYHVLKTYNFSLNISNTNIGNNNEPTLQKTFTHYPLRQMTSALYKSGTLQAMIGRNMDGTYYDSTDMADAIYALSISENPKFLKSPKGELWQIETSGAVQMTVNSASALQPYTVSFPWVEVADAENVSIIG